MKKFALIFIALLHISFAKQAIHSFEIDLDLKKDEIVRADIDSSKDSQSQARKDFTMRWTLYRNEGLVVLVTYDKFRYQFILYKDYRLNNWQLNTLDTQGVNRSPNQPYIRIYFIDIQDPFDDEKTIARLKIYGYGDVSFSRK